MPLPPAWKGRSCGVAAAVARYDGHVEERAACALLKQRFEAAGFTIEDNRMFDEDGVRFEIDGFDARHRVGYEYTTREAGDEWDVDEAVIAAVEERRRRGELYLLIVDEAHAPDAAALGSAAEAFLADLRERGVGPSTAGTDAGAAAPPNEPPASDGEPPQVAAPPAIPDEPARGITPPPAVADVELPQAAVAPALAADPSPQAATPRDATDAEAPAHVAAPPASPDAEPPQAAASSGTTEPGRPRARATKPKTSKAKAPSAPTKSKSSKKKPARK